jgi:hypothetical protein
VADGEVADRAVQRRGQRAAQAGVRPGLDLPRPPARADGHRAELAEQHGLAHTAQTGEHEAAFGTPAGDAFEHDVERVELLVRPASSGGRWPAPGAKGFRTGSTIGRYPLLSPFR